MKKTTQLQELRGLETEALRKRLNDTEEELMKLRFKHASTQLDQTASLRDLRLQIARIKTVQTEMLTAENQKQGE